jgi:hypothetical protein
MKKNNSLSKVEQVEERLVQIAKVRPLTYTDIEPIVEHLAKIKCSQFGEIGVYGHDDVAQEIRLKCNKILHKYSPESSNALNFFGSCTDNLLRDLRRRHTLRRTNICSRCAYYRKKKCFLHNDDLIKCERYKTYLENKKRKECIARMKCNPEFAWHTQESNGFLFNNEDYYLQAISQIREVLPPKLTYAFDMVMASSGLTPEMEEELYKEVRTIIRDSIDW